jgi:hypothetical protein
MLVSRRLQVSNFSIDELFERLEYDPATGVLTWKHSAEKFFKDKRAHKIWNTRYAGKQAATKQRNRRMVLCIRGQKLLAHRVAYALHNGVWPSQEVDHINGNPSDNRAANLRDVSKSDNMRNQKVNSANKTGVIGVAQYNGKWRAYIQNNGKPESLGFFNCKTAAHLARASAEIRLGYHENHGAR